MIRLRAGVFALLAACSTTSASSAPAPTNLWCRDAGRIVLPNGERGAMCAWGEKFSLATGLRRIFLTDAHGSVLARSYASYSWWLICTHDRCDAVDNGKEFILEFDPATFRAGPTSAQERSELWTLWEQRDEMWGFRARPVTWRDHVRLEDRLALTLLACGALVGVMLALREKYVLRAVVAGEALVFCLAWTLVSLLPFTLAGALLAAGAIPIWLGSWLVSRLWPRRRPALSH